VGAVTGHEPKPHGQCWAVDMAALLPPPPPSAWRQAPFTCLLAISVMSWAMSLCRVASPGSTGLLPAPCLHAHAAAGMYSQQSAADCA
jgi:hypothetical protein